MIILLACHFIIFVAVVRYNHIPIYKWPSHLRIRTRMKIKQILHFTYNFSPIFPSQFSDTRADPWQQCYFGQHREQRRHVVFNVVVDSVVCNVGCVRRRPLSHVVPQSRCKVAGHCTLQGCQKNTQSSGAGNSCV